MGSHRGRQRQLERQKRKRAVTVKAARASRLAQPSEAEALLRRAESSPHGPAFMSACWREGDGVPGLVTVIITRLLPDGRMIAALSLVDRTCLGVKNGFASVPMTADELAEQLERIGVTDDAPVERVSLLEAQSVLFHAIDYARSLGFEPHADFAARVVGSRPDHLLDTPLARPERPVYLSGPDDDQEMVLRQLARAVGDDGCQSASALEQMKRKLEGWLP